MESYYTPCKEFDADISNDGVDYPVMQHIVLGCDIYFLRHKFCVRVIILQGL